MCGLCGILGPGIVKPDLDSLKNLIYVSALRGFQGTGILQARVNSWRTGSNVKHMIQKDVMTSGYWLWHHQYTKDGNREVAEGVNNNLFAAHVRAATMGKVCKENTHPFEFENIIGMHNGTMKDKKYESEDDEKTDSELFLKDINDRGLKTVLEEVDPDSAYALVIFDKKTGTVTFTNNGKREIHFAIGERRPVLYWASEPEMIRLACTRNKIDLLDDKTVKFEPFKTFSINPDQLKGGEDKIWFIDNITPKEKKAIAGFLAPPEWANAPFVPVNQPEGKSEKKEKSKEELPTKPRIRLKNLKDRIPSVKCCGCQKSMTPVDCFYGLEISANTFVCKDCQADEDALKDLQVETEVKVG